MFAILAAVVALAAGPPTVNGVYVQKNACPFEGCDTSTPWRALRGVQLYALPGSAKVVGRLAPGARARVLTSEYHAHPRRGGVGVTADPFVKGDVIWTLVPEGEGYVSVWRRGEILDLPPQAPGMEGDPGVVWDKAPAAQDLWWVKVRGPKGLVGWVRDPTGDDFACMDSLGGDRGCGGR
jgi:hypothetical protein